MRDGLRLSELQIEGAHAGSGLCAGRTFLVAPRCRGLGHRRRRQIGGHHIRRAAIERERETSIRP
jgi:hypothetical protein